MGDDFGAVHRGWRVELKQLIERAQTLPAMPVILQELIETLGDDAINTSEIVRRISADQVLSAKLLRVANSAYYGAHRQVASVQDAVALLGFNSVRTLVLASGITGVLAAPKGFDLKHFWGDSFAVAALCRWLARYSRDQPEIAFTCGMLHNIGELLIHILLPQEAAELGQVNKGDGLSAEREKILLGFNFPEAGAELANCWKFPQVIVDAIRYQLQPQAVQPFSRYAALIYLAICVVAANRQSVALGEDFPWGLVELLGIDCSKIPQALAEVRDLGQGFDILLH